MISVLKETYLNASNKLLQRQFVQKKCYFATSYSSFGQKFRIVMLITQYFISLLGVFGQTLRQCDAPELG